ncbi:MAG: hypothetical protein HQL15_07935 [Candidatus Omnitrophica bacterium]|nr:hypothetical protein [Candidatus Omnitrophota bacterium]
MCNQRSNKAMTLIEILVATAVASMVLFGALLSTTALQKSTNDFGANYANKAQSSAVLDHILRNAGLAMGSDMGPEFDKGILIGSAETGDADTVCIHQDVDDKGVENLDSAQDTKDDHWLCYSLKTSGTTRGIYYCYKSYDSSVSCPTCRGASACSVTDKFLGTASSWIPSFKLNGRQLLFTMSITSRLKSTSDVKSNDGSNPETTVSGGVSPAMHSIGIYVPCLSNGHACDGLACGSNLDNCKILQTCPNTCTGSHQRCNETNNLCLTDGYWSDWGDCSKTCGSGIQTRTCTEPTNGGIACLDLGQGGYSQSCNTQPCPVAGGWGCDYTGSSVTCSASSGSGHLTGGTPVCNNPPPQNGGTCPVTTPTCDSGPACCTPLATCPVGVCDSAYSDGCTGTINCSTNCPSTQKCSSNVCVNKATWGSWSSCGPACSSNGIGIQARKCSSGSPKPYTDCTTDQGGSYSQACSVPICSPWTCSYGPCSGVCGPNAARQYPSGISCSSVCDPTTMSSSCVNKRACTCPDPCFKGC